jgi:glycerol transport system ATP-binding protein
MAITLEKIGKQAGGETHLADIDLTLQPGTMNVLLGHTGAGKTSLLRILAGLDRPTSGAVKRDGVNITRTTARERSVALVYQQFINYPSLSVRANIASPLRAKKAAEREARVSELAKLLSIEELLDRLPAELSGGQQQRVAIARALAKGAEIVLFDEPLVNLDYKLREGLRDELRALFGGAGARAVGGRAATVVYATTDPAEALALGGTTILMHHGRVLQHAPTLEVYHRPSSVAAARVFSDPPMNLLGGEVAGGELLLEGGLRIERAQDPHPAHLVHLAALADGAYRFGIRASDCRLSRRHAGEVAVTGKVELSEISGSETFVYLRTARAGAAPLIVQQDGVFHHSLDEELTIYLDPRRLLVFEAAGAHSLVASYRPLSSAAPTPLAAPTSSAAPLQEG